MFTLRRNRTLTTISVVAVACFALAQSQVAFALPETVSQSSFYEPVIEKEPAPVQTLADSTVTPEAAVQRDEYTVILPPPPPPPPPVVVPEPEPVVEESSPAESSEPKTYNAPSFTPDPGSAQEYAATAVAARGWGVEEFYCLVSLWNRESGWRANAMNSSSGAYGIPQALPGNKMAAAGEDWETNANTQIEWGLNYIQGRYLTPCGAWAHSEENGWY